MEQDLSTLVELGKEFMWNSKILESKWDDAVTSITGHLAADWHLAVWLRRWWPWQDLQGFSFWELIKPQFLWTLMWHFCLEESYLFFWRVISVMLQALQFLWDKMMVSKFSYRDCSQWSFLIASLQLTFLSNVSLWNFTWEYSSRLWCCSFSQEGCCSGAALA